MDNLMFVSESSSGESVDDDFLLFDDEEELFLHARARPKNENYLGTVEHYNDSEFLEHFRVSPAIATNLAERLEQSAYYNQQSGGNGKLSAYNQVLIFLWYAGHQTASFRDVADRFDVTISCLHRIIQRLTYFVSNLAHTVITWPDEHEKQQIANAFRATGFPHVIGAIDGSHIRIDKPEGDPDSYYNRKKYFSIQLQAICDHRRKIRSLFVGFPGAVHDARVFHRSPIGQMLTEKCGPYVILGDSAYPCLRNLITPFRDTGTLSRQQRKFNQRLSSNRYLIEHCFGILKQKFRQLYHCKLRKVEDIVHFIRACCVLHNLAIDDDFPIAVDREMEPAAQRDEDVDVDADAPEGAAYRNYLMTTLNL